MKILKVIANNFKNCEDNYTISYVPIANKTQEDKVFELHEIADDLFVYKTLGIIGKNASGKSTTVQLLTIIYDVFSNYKIKFSTNIFKYIENKKIDLTIYFYHEGLIYKYITSLSNNDILSNTIVFNNQKLYSKKYMKSYAKNIFDDDKFKECDTSNIILPPDTSLIFSLFGDYNVRGFYYLSEDSFPSYSTFIETYKLMNNTKLLGTMLKIFDEHIENIDSLDKDSYVITYNNREKKEVNSDKLFNILSSGTNKGFELFTFAYISLVQGADLVIDEIENHFHKTLVENLINLYKDPSVNKKNATLIFTTHYPELLDLFNRDDNIYICKYDKSIILENMHEKYSYRPELLKSKKFYENAFGTEVNYELLMNFKKELM